MKYFVLLAGYGDLPTWDELSPEEQEAGMQRHYDFGRVCGEREGVAILAGEALGDAATATTMRTARNGDDAPADGVLCGPR